MIRTKEQTEEMLEAAKPLMKWMSNNCDPHCTATVDVGGIVLAKEVALQITGEFLCKGN